MHNLQIFDVVLIVFSLPSYARCLKQKANDRILHGMQKTACIQNQLLDQPSLGFTKIMTEERFFIYKDRYQTSHSRKARKINAKAALLAQQNANNGGGGSRLGSSVSCHMSYSVTYCKAGLSLWLPVVLLMNSNIYTIF